MKPFIFIALILFAFKDISAQQQSILDSLHQRWITPTIIREYGNSLYFFTMKQNYGVTTFYHNPTQFTLHKASKENFQYINSVNIIGDTVQADSTTHFLDISLCIEGSRIYVFYSKTTIVDSLSPVNYRRYLLGLYYTQLDTALNIIVPEKRIFLTDGSQKFIGITSISCVANNGISIVCFSQSDSTAALGYDGSMSSFIKLDPLGSVLQQDTLYKPFVYTNSSSLQHMVTEILPFPGNKFFVAGYGICNFEKYAAYIGDINLNVSDTFYVKPEFFFDPPDVTGYLRNRMSVILPSGNIIQGGLYYHYGNTSAGLNGVFAKFSYTNRFTLSKYTVVPAKDNSYLIHGLVPPQQAISYNKTDGNIYSACYTHAGQFGINCAGNDNYVQVTCADTNLNIKWIKYIYSGANTCAEVCNTIPCDNRSGVLVAGVHYDIQAPVDTNSLKNNSFLYRLDSSGNLSVPKSTAIARDRIEIYPNPATTSLQLDDIFNQLTKIEVFDLRGIKLLSQKLEQGHNTVSLAVIPSGLYLVKIYADSDEVKTFKFLKN